jgi:pyruvate dehydrogenase E2 component (dihydrolipoamide acetyltransferase)
MCTGPNGRIQAEDVENYVGANRDSETKITPLAKNIAKVNDVDIYGIKGSGINEKIMKIDVMKAIKSQNIVKENSNDSEGRTVPLTEMRKVIGSRMSESYFAAPTFTLNIDVDMDKVTELRKEINSSIMDDIESKVTFTDFIILATSKALQKYKIVNSSLVEDGILLYDDVNIALAVGLDEGLLVPIIKKAQHKSISEIAEAREKIIEKVQNKKILPKEMEGSTFTISNLGMFGITHFNPIINQPNSAILGVGSIDKKMVIIEDKPEIRPIMTLSLTIDHRVVDGVPGAKFLQYIKKLLENPMLMFI